MTTKIGRSARSPQSVRPESVRPEPVEGRRALRALVQVARSVRKRAYAPYSRFRVGAAVSGGGQVFVGANVENASYGLTVCAERAAVAAAITGGARRIDAVAIASGTSPPTPPCGACLQTLAEFAGPELLVVLAGARGEIVETTLGELLPRGFSGKYLKTKA